MKLCNDNKVLYCVLFLQIGAHGYGERERETETDRETDRERHTETHRDRQTEGERWRSNVVLTLIK